MKKFLLVSNGSSINNFETIYSADLVSIGTMINDLDGLQGYSLMSERNIKNNKMDLIPLTFEEVMEIEFDFILTSQFAFNAFGGQVSDLFLHFVEYCQKYTKIPIMQFSLDRKIPLVPLYNRECFANLAITNPVIAVPSYEIEDYIKRSEKDKVTNVVEIIHHDFHTYSPYMMNFHKDIYTDKVSEDEDNKPDVIYGGILRPDRKKFFDEYFDPNKNDFKVEIYGTLGRKGYGHIKTGKIPQSKVVSKNGTAIATIIPPEKNYETIVQARVYESFLSDSVTFVHNDFDPNHNLSDNMFRYFSSYDEFVEKLNLVKKDEELRNILLAEQHDLLNRIVDWSKEFAEINKIVKKVISYGK